MDNIKTANVKLEISYIAYGCAKSDNYFVNVWEFLNRLNIPYHITLQINFYVFTQEK